MEDAKIKELELYAYMMRKTGLEMIREANSGHIGGSFSIAEILSVLYFEKMNTNPKQPHDPDRDRFILSKGHCTPTTYAALSMKGFFPKEDLKGFRKIDSHMSGHMEMHIPGVDMSTGSLGQGLSVGIGMAEAARIDNRKYMTYVITGDGELEEGQNWEAIMYAGNHSLNNLILIVDYNKLQLDDTVEHIESLDPLDDKFKAFKWNVLRIDGHNIKQISEAIDKAKMSNSEPTVIIADTIKGKGVSIFEGGIKWHGNRPNDEEYKIAFKELDNKIVECGGE